MGIMSIVIIAIIIAIICGEKFRVNSGILAVAFAYIIGSFILNLLPEELYLLWPTQLFMVIFGVSFFFNFANTNGTLEILGSHIIYIFRDHLFWLPLGFFFTTALISGLGGGVWSSVPIVGALALPLCKQANMNKTIVSIAVVQGGLSGGNFVFGPHGAIIRALIERSPLAEQSFDLTNQIFFVSISYPILLILLMMFLDKRKAKLETLQLAKPETFNKQQKKTLSLILLFISIMLLVPVISNFNQSLKWLSDLNERLDLGLVAIIFGLVAYMLKLSDGRKVLDRTPWDTIWLTCGMAFLIGVGAEAGITQQLANIITYIPTPVMPIVLTFLCGFMSIFSSTVGVIAPLLFPTLESIFLATGINPSLIAICIIVGGFSAGGAPFSDAGSLLLSASGGDLGEQKQLYQRLLFKVAPLCVAAAVVTMGILTIFYFI
ncbi:hypothetical protein LQF67_07840 [Tetragenococcus halophilus]|uniref:SLC13 family permease n=1 Tax=Tetragenococcus halophilus TaxID=51669 RepID=UPI001F31B885|nr:SLC13 family permease [Tetragenococcus halophilus]MCF1685500.1 hypothetical protein [Tetragenococcus halophilus]